MKHFIVSAFMLAQVIFMAPNGDMGLLYDMGGRGGDVMFVEPLSPRSTYDTHYWPATTRVESMQEQIDRLKQEVRQYDPSFIIQLETIYGK